MKIHYLNLQGEQTFIDKVIHLQNVDNEHFLALLDSGKELSLRVGGIEGIVDSSVIEEERGKSNDTRIEDTAKVV